MPHSPRGSRNSGLSKSPEAIVESIINPIDSQDMRYSARGPATYSKFMCWLVQSSNIEYLSKNPGGLSGEIRNLITTEKALGTNTPHQKLAEKAATKMLLARAQISHENTKSLIENIVSRITADDGCSASIEDLARETGARMSIIKLKDEYSKTLPAMINFFKKLTPDNKFSTNLDQEEMLNLYKNKGSLLSNIKSAIKGADGKLIAPTREIVERAIAITLKKDYSAASEFSSEYPSDFISSPDSPLSDLQPSPENSPISSLLLDESMSTPPLSPSESTPLGLICYTSDES